jgi:hypothetical protein
VIVTRAGLEAETAAEKFQIVDSERSPFNPGVVKQPLAVTPQSHGKLSDSELGSVTPSYHQFTNR